MFSTEASDPTVAEFILGPVTSMPFKMQFDIKASMDGFVYLAENETPASVFASIAIGGWGNSKSILRACYADCIEVEHNERGLLSGTEYRPFWIEYDGGVVTVGKGGQIESFLELNVGAYNPRIPSQVYVGIAAYKYTGGSWVFHNFCK